MSTEKKIQNPITLAKCFLCLCICVQQRHPAISVFSLFSHTLVAGDHSDWNNSADFVFLVYYI